MTQLEQNTTKITRPSILLLMTEIGRAAMEFGMFQATKSYISKRTKGDGHPVLVLPGFMVGDTSTQVLRQFLLKKGYMPHTWNLGRNYGGDEFPYLINDRVEEIYQEHQQKVSIVGWSLGGLYARIAAQSMPEKIRQVIMLGSPFMGLTEPNNVEWIYQLLNNGKKVEEVDATFLDILPKPPKVPSTAIYTKEDGIVSWKVCMEKEINNIRQNIQVRGSHCGLSFNPTVLRIIADRLKYSEKNWKKFTPKNKYVGTFLYPKN